MRDEKTKHAEVSLDEILGDMKLDLALVENAPQKTRKAVTLWLTPEAKARYDRIQSASHREFSRKAQKVLLALIELAEKRAG